MYAALYMPATRTQVYLTAEQRRRIDRVARRQGVTLAHIVRTAVDRYLAEPDADLEAALERTFGSMPRLDVPSRDEWDTPRR